MTDFDSLEAIDKHYKKAVAEADETTVPSVQFEWDRAKFSFERNQFQAERSALQRDRALTAILKENPQLEGLEEFITGSNEEEMRAAATKLASRFTPAQDPAYQAYGPASGTQGAPVSRGPGDERKEQVDSVARKIKTDTPLTKLEAQQFIRTVGNSAMSSLIKARRTGQGAPNGR